MGRFARFEQRFRFVRNHHADIWEVVNATLLARSDLAARLGMAQDELSERMAV